MIWLIVIIAIAAYFLFIKKPVTETSVLGENSPAMPPAAYSSTNVIYQEPVIVETSVLGVNSPIMSGSGGTIIKETPASTRVHEYNELKNLMQQ